MSKPISRRTLVRNSFATTLLAAAPLVASSAAAVPVLGATGSREVRSTPIGSQRINLEEAGPMIPPVPAILLTVNGMAPGLDEISVVWTFVINGKPPQIGISVENVHVALPMIRRHGEFVLNVPTVDMINAFDHVDMNSTKVRDKFELSGLTREPAQLISAPAIQESPIHVECKVFNTVEVPPVRTVFFAEVVATNVLAGACDQNGKLLVDNVPFFGMTAGSGEFYTMGEKVGHIGKSVGRSDIKY